MTEVDVLIVGAGPTGLALALWLTKQGLKVRIIDKSSGPGETSRAMAVQARTLEFYRQLDMADAVVSAGYKTPAMNIWVKGKRQAQIKFFDAGQEISPYPFILVYPQDRHERLLVDRLQSLGVEVERQTEFVSLEEKGNKVAIRLKHKNGLEETCEALYLAGCDGARSPIRHQIGSGFEGGTYKQVFYVADVVATGVNPAGEGQIAFEKSKFILMLPYTSANQYRLIGIVGDQRAEHSETLTFEDFSHAAIKALHVKIEQVNWFSTYRVHHRVTDHFRKGRIFLLGDAAHIHSPVGGQGMNTGILDAINLAWKLAAVIKGQAPDSLLDSYQTERQAFANTLVETTDRLFSFATAEGNFAQFVRTRISPLFISIAYKLESVREYMFRVVSQTSLSYHQSPLSAGKAGSLQGGDRLPWVATSRTDNYESLSSIGWQVHVYGEPKSDLKIWCDQHKLPLHIFVWQSEYQKAGFAQGATYLLRPDNYIALADPEGSAATLNRYFSEREIKLTA